MLKVVVNGEEFFFSDSSLHSMDYDACPCIESVVCGKVSAFEIGLGSTSRQPLLLRWNLRKHDFDKRLGSTRCAKNKACAVYGLCLPGRCSSGSARVLISCATLMCKHIARVLSRRDCSEAYGGATDRPSGQAVGEGSPPIAVAIQGSQQTFVPDQLGNMLWFSTILEIFRFYVHMRPSGCRSSLDGKPHDASLNASELCQLAMGLSHWTGQQLFRALQEHFRWLGTVSRSCCWCCSGSTGDSQQLLRLED